MKSTLIIPYYNKWNLTHACLFDLYKHCPGSNVVLVNDCSTDDDCVTGPAWWQGGPFQGRLKYYRNKENMGFGVSMNVGAEIAIKNGADVIVLLSNDVSVKSDIAREAIELIEQHKEPVLVGVHLVAVPIDWNTMLGVGVIPYLNGWLLACHKDVWKTLGGFDTRYGRANMEDVDLSTVAWYNHITLVTLLHSKVSHMSGQTVSTVMSDIERLELTNKNKELWLAKWYDKREELKEAIYGKA